MKTRYYTSLCLFAAVALLVTGCFEEDIQSYDGPPQIGFELQGSEATVWDGSGSHSATVMLIAPHQSADLQAQVGIDAEATTASSDNYSFNEVVTISANTSTTDFVVDIHDGGIPPGETRTVTFVLEQALSDGVVLAENLRTHTVFINALRAIVEAEPEALDFGEVDAEGLITAGEDSTQTLTIQNTGNRATTLSTFSIEGDGAAAFSFEADQEFIVEPGGEVEIEVTFEPQDEGEYEAELVFTWTNGVSQPDGAEFTVSLSGATTGAGNGNSD